MDQIIIQTLQTIGYVVFIISTISLLTLSLVIMHRNIINKIKGYEIKTK